MGMDCAHQVSVYMNANFPASIWACAICIYLYRGYTDSIRLCHGEMMIAVFSSDSYVGSNRFLCLNSHVFLPPVAGQSVRELTESRGLGLIAIGLS